jgi:hypothetical protein
LLLSSKKNCLCPMIQRIKPHANSVLHEGALF